MMDFKTWLSSPGSRKAVTRAAVSMFPALHHSPQEATTTSEGTGTDPGVKGEETPKQMDQKVHENAAYVISAVDEQKAKRLDRWLDNVVAFAGSTPVTGFILMLVLLWALLGIRFGQDNDWQVVISDVQALVCYVLDSLLMRQQLNAYNREICIAADLQSRSIGVRRMLRTVRTEQLSDSTAQETKPAISSSPNAAAVSMECSPPKSHVNTMIDGISALVGSFPSLVLFWIGIFIWLGFGNYCQWSATWLLYINSATSALMLTVFALLTCLQEQHRHQMSSLFRQICDLDARLELRLRALTADEIENVVATVPPPQVGPLERAISYYADLVGTLAGIAILTVVLIAWIAIGPALRFGTNWWLIIGTYAGLIGLHDGFVLHNIRSQLDKHSNAALLKVSQDDAEALALVSLTSADAVIVGVTGDIENGFQCPERTDKGRRSRAKAAYLHFRAKISDQLSDTLSHSLMVVAGIVLIIGLVVGASVLQWNLTGQLLCNFPPSIVETFVMMALITREKEDWGKEIQKWQAIGRNRALVLNWLDGIAPK